MRPSLELLSRPVYLISGPVGAGKTTLARKLVDRFPPAAHIENEVFKTWSCPTDCTLTRSTKAEAERQLLIKRRNVALLADNFFESSITPVIDDVVIFARALQEYKICSARDPWLSLCYPRHSRSRSPETRPGLKSR